MLEIDAPRLGREAALNVFAGKLAVVQDSDSYLISVTYTSQDREKAALIANRVAEMYVADQLNTKLVATDRASGWLEERLQTLREEVRQADQAVAEYQTKNNLVASQGVMLNDQELSDLNRQLITARADLAERQAKLRLVREMRSRGEALDAMADVASSPLILNLREQEAQLVREEADLRSLYGARHPRMVNLQNEKSDLAQKIKAEINRVTQILENDVRVASSRVGSLETAAGRPQEPQHARTARPRSSSPSCSATRRRTGSSTIRSLPASRRPRSSRTSSSPTCGW